MLFRKSRVEPRLDAELQFHIDETTAQYVRDGMNPEEARRRAQIEFGGKELIKEEIRDVWTVMWLDHLMRDLRIALRSLVMSPGFTLAAILALTLGIGANTALFSLVDRLLLRPLPFGDADRLVMIWESAPQMGFPQNTVAAGNFMDWTKQSQVFTGMAASRNRQASLTGDGPPETIIGRAATANLFEVLGVKPLLGRTFTEQEDRAGDSVVVIGYGLWQSRYGRDPDIIGRKILLDGVPNIVIGVMPAEFSFPSREFQFWAPAHFTLYC